MDCENKDFKRILLLKDKISDLLFEKNCGNWLKIVDDATLSELEKEETILISKMKKERHCGRSDD